MQNPGKFNRLDVSYNPKFWNNSKVQLTNNCYSYAFNTPCKPNGRPFGSRSGFFSMFAMQPGSLSGHRYPVVNIKKKLVQYAIEDGEAAGLYIKECTGKPGRKPRGAWKVALFVEEFGKDSIMDYHWYRRGPDGFWTHKQGDHPIKDTDSVGRKIRDPRKANKGGYNTLIAFFWVVPMKGKEVLEIHDVTIKNALESSKYIVKDVNQVG